MMSGKQKMIDDSPQHPFNILRSDEYKHSIEKKGKFDYLSWAICWDKMKECDPAARYELVNILDTGTSKLVHVRLYYDWDGDPCTHDEYLAVRDFRNQAVADPDSAMVENTFRRAIAKAISMATGYGLDLWINEDIRALDYKPNTVRDVEVKTDRLARHAVFTTQETRDIKAKVKAMTVEDATNYNEKLVKIINQRKEKEVQTNGSTN